MVPDLASYEANPGLYLDYRTEMIGEKVEDVEQLARLVEAGDFDLSGYDAFLARHLDACDGGAARRVVDRFRGPSPQRARLRADVHDHD